MTATRRTSFVAIARITACLAIAGSPALRADDGPFQATGFKVGEVSDTSAIVWTRLTRNAERNPADGPMVEIKYTDAQRGRQREVESVQYPEGVTVEGIRNAVPGAAGQVRAVYRAGVNDPWQATTWEAVDPARDFTRQFTIENLAPDTRYAIRIEARRDGADDSPRSVSEGTFRTAPDRDTPGRVVFTVSTGQAYNDQDREDGFNIYPVMRELDPSFFVHTGDIVYYDQLAKDASLARYHWQRTYSLPTNVAFHRQVASYFIKDDHDVWMNDCWPSMNTRFMHEFTFAQGQAIFREQVPMGDDIYRSYRWGRDLEIWLVEGRDFRSPNNMPDGPEKTIWGQDQKDWFKRTVAASDATFRILISPTPIVGPDRTNKNDNHSNKGFTHEGDELRAFIAGQKNLFVVCGDRHWQYMSVHPETQVREYSCGPASDRHAGGWQKDDFRPEYHRYLNVIGGFLSVTVDRATGGQPAATFRYHDVNGEVKFEDVRR